MEEVRVCCECITAQDFYTMFPEFMGINKVEFCSIYLKAHTYIDPHACPSGWLPEQHKLGVFLAMAHCLYKTQTGQELIKKNGRAVEDYAGTGNITMATEGSVSIMKKVYSPATATESDLMGSIYGEQLLALYEGIQPPMEEVHPAPYYPVGYKWY